MNKILFLLICLFSSTLSAYELKAKAALSNTNGYYVLSDGSCWKVVALTPRWRSFSEWWEGIELNYPANYDCVPSNWRLGDEIEVCPNDFLFEIDESVISNPKTIASCTHALFNRHTKEVLFGIPLDPASFLVTVFNSAYKDGYNSGYDDGYDLARTIYDR
jgi:hypothetical protein